MKPARLPTDPNRALNAAIDLKAPPERIVDALSAALAADTVNRDGSRGPDHKTRVQAALALLHFRVGRPVERSEVINVNLDADSMSGLRERLAASPAMRQTLAGLLAEACDFSPTPGKSFDLQRRETP
jgi:hypothetical protein